MLSALPKGSPLVGSGRTPSPADGRPETMSIHMSGGHRCTWGWGARSGKGFLIWLVSSALPRLVMGKKTLQHRFKQDNM